METKKRLLAVLEKLPVLQGFEAYESSEDGAQVITLDSKRSRQYVSFHCWPELLYMHVTRAGKRQTLDHMHYEFGFGPEAEALREGDSPAHWIECPDLDTAVARAVNQLQIWIGKT